MSLSISTFAYVGVEVVAASALEARWPKNERHNTDMSDRSADHLLIGQTVKFSAVYIPVLATVAYILAGVLASFNIRRDDCRLPRLSWADSSHSQQCTLNPRASPASSSDVGKTSSAFVAIAEESRIPSLNDVFNVFLVFTALTCACTNLYVASRSLFGLTTRLDGSDDQPLFLRALAWFGKTDRRKVPMRAMIFSALAFCWVPFLQLHEDSSNISMASVPSPNMMVVCRPPFRGGSLLTPVNAVYRNTDDHGVRRGHHRVGLRVLGFYPILPLVSLCRCVFSVTLSGWDFVF